MKMEKLLMKMKKIIIVLLLILNFPCFFISFDLAPISDQYNENGELKKNISTSFANLLAFNRVKDNLDFIKNLIVEELMLFNKKYLLKGLICCPFSGHYNTILINHSKDLHLLKKD